MRGSVHICLPNLSKDKERFEGIAKKYNVQIRGIHGEHSESNDGVFDISNRQRLGKGERSLVQDMYEGVKAMIAAEKEILATKKWVQLVRWLKPRQQTQLRQFMPCPFTYAQQGESPRGLTLGKAWWAETNFFKFTLSQSCL